MTLIIPKLPVTKFLNMSLLPDLKKLARNVQKNPDGFYYIQARKIYILPTRFGLMYATMVLAMLVGSINYANNLGFLLTFFFAGIGVLVMHYTWLNLLNLKVQLLPSEPVFAGQTASYRIIIHNPSSQDRGLIEASFNQNKHAAIDFIPAESSQPFSIEIPVDHRGWYNIERVVIATQHPLGLFRAWSYLSADSRFLVYPKPSNQWLPVKTPDYSPNASGHKGVGADDFIAHRNYRPSDSPRQIDWKVFAREKGLMTKQFGGDRNEQLMLSLDLVRDAPLETALSKLTRAVLDAEKDHVLYGLELPNGKITINNGDSHKHACLKLLALYGTEA